MVTFIAFLASNLMTISISDGVYQEYMNLSNHFTIEKLLDNKELITHDFEKWVLREEEYRIIANDSGHVLYPLALFRTAQYDYIEGRSEALESKLNRIIGLEYDADWKEKIPKKFFHGNLGEDEYSGNLFLLKKMACYYFINKFRAKPEWQEACKYHRLIKNELLGEVTRFNRRHYGSGCIDETVMGFGWGIDQTPYSFSEIILDARCHLQKGETLELKNILGMFTSSRASSFPEQLNVPREIEGLLFSMIECNALDKWEFKKHLDAELEYFLASAKPAKGCWYVYSKKVQGIKITLETYGVFEELSDVEVAFANERCSNNKEIKTKTQIVKEFKTTFFYKFFE
jgi:hypothetical protein